jgi:hypothetical protein
MSVTPVSPTRCGHVAPMVIDRVEGGCAARCLRCGRPPQKRGERCWSGGGVGQDSCPRRRLHCAHPEGSKTAGRLPSELRRADGGSGC